MFARRWKSAVRVEHSLQTSSASDRWRLVNDHGSAVPRRNRPCQWGGSSLWSLVSQDILSGGVPRNGEGRASEHFTASVIYLLGPGSLKKNVKSTIAAGGDLHYSNSDPKNYKSNLLDSECRRVRLVLFTSFRKNVWPRNDISRQVLTKDAWTTRSPPVFPLFSSISLVETRSQPGYLIPRNSKLYIPPPRLMQPLYVNIWAFKIPKLKWLDRRKKKRNQSLP